MFGDARLPERFWEKVIPEPNSGCWLWTGTTCRGLAMCYVGKRDGKYRVVSTARVAYEAFHGDLEKTQDAQRRCGNSLCCNPTHIAAERLLTPDERRKYKREWALSALATRPEVREQKRQNRRRAYERAPEKAKARQMEWREANRETWRDLQRAWRRKNPHKQKQHQRKKYLKANYGITPAELDAMLAAQSGLCAICRCVLNACTKSRMHIDHDHSTGEVRGLLCVTCNLGLGAFRDSRDSLQKAIEYLTRAGGK